MASKASIAAGDWREQRRKRAWELYQHGWKQSKIAEALGVSAGAVSQWITRGKDNGPAALSARVASGKRAGLSDEQCQQLVALLEQGATAHGFHGDVWTRDRLRQMIGKHFAISYGVRHCGRIFKRIGWTRQKPTVRATQRNEEAIETWKRERWPALKKTSAVRTSHNHLRR